MARFFGGDCQSDMSRKIEELIAIHNRILNSSAAADPFIEQRIKARCREKAILPTLVQSLNFRLVRTVAAYALLLFVLISANFFFIQTFKTQKQSVREAETDMAIFTAAVPGSLTSAFSEVSRWEK